MSDAKPQRGAKAEASGAVVVPPAVETEPEIESAVEQPPPVEANPATPAPDQVPVYVDQPGPQCLCTHAHMGKYHSKCPVHSPTREPLQAVVFVDPSECLCSHAHLGKYHDECPIHGPTDSEPLMTVMTIGTDAAT
jgi:hypothetical protein